MNTIDWEKIYLQLYAYTHSLLDSFDWFRSNKSDSYLMGKQVEDYVMEAITRHLEHPEKYNPSTGRSLLNYLKQHIILTLVGNDARSKENKTSSELFVSNDEDEEDELQLTSCLPIINPIIEEGIDHENILSSIEQEVQNDEIACIIFRGICREGEDKDLITQKYSIKDSDYFNGLKRLRRVIEKIAREYNKIQKQ